MRDVVVGDADEDVDAIGVRALYGPRSSPDALVARVVADTI